MKNQALTTTLAVLLAVSLSAIVALVVSSEVIGAQPTADTPAAINVIVPAEQPQTQPPAVQDNVVTPANDTDDAATDETPAAPAGEDTVDPDDDTVDPGDDDVDPGDDDADPGDDDVDSGDDTIDPDEDDVEVDEDECIGGTVIDDICVVNPIDCLLGYDYVDGGCIFIGCPFGYKLVGDFCQELGLVAPCDAGFTRIGGICVPILVLEPGVLVPICPAGQNIQAGICVLDFKVNPDFVLPGLELAADG